MDFATALLPKLAELLKDEYNLHTGARKGIEFLQKELETMHAALEKIGEVPREQLDKLQRIWARDVRDLSYDMEDTVDTFMVDVEGPERPSKRGAKKVIRKMMRKVTKAMARREVAQEINGIKERVMELANRRDRYKVDDIAPTKKTHMDPRLEALYTKVTELVGIGEAKGEVITRLANGDQQETKVVSIAGFGGLGKTTLARAVHDEIKKDFDCTAFVSVSRNPDMEKLLKDILYGLDKEKFEDIHSKMLDERILIDKAIEFLKNKRYLIVIDDIWDEEPWDKVIRHALIENNMRSRIITTTRIIDVAEHIGGCYRLKPLSKESSEMLFYGRIFGSKDIFPMQFSEVSKKILKKCGGIPLAIITASGLLANKSENIKEWFKVCDSIGSGLGSNHVMDSMRKILLLSYYDLPFHLKTCLLYLSIFPEDYAISKTQLIWRWVAEGFVQQAGDQSLFEIGKSYFNELLNRSLIQPAYMDRDGTPRACRVHDTVLDLVISLSIKEQFITILGDGKHSLESKYQVRWLSLLHNNNTAWPSMKMPKLRSLTIFKPTGVVIDPMTPSISCYHLLRVLDLQGCNVEDLASLGFVGSLTHLRYLGLPSSSTNAKLPVEMGKLRFLQTLDLSKAGVKEMPSSVITGLGGQLMCLRGQNGLGTDLSSDLLENLTSLELLESATVTSKCTAEKLGRLTQLRVLSVIIRLSTPDDEEWSACTNALVESLGKLTRIESLQIHHHRFYPIDLEGSMAEPLENLCRLVCIDLATLLPGWIQPASLPILSYLEIDVRDERREDIKVLGTLSCLRHLVFRVRLAPELQVLERCVVGPDAFPCLVSCEFRVRGGGVVPGIFPRGAMPRLQNFKFSVKPEHFWSGGGSTVDVLVLGHLPSLRSVTVTLGFLHNREDDTIKSVREKLEHEAAAHPNHPLRILFTS